MLHTTMKYTLQIWIPALALLLGTSACGDFLDTVPDNRTEIDTETKLANWSHQPIPGPTTP